MEGDVEIYSVTLSTGTSLVADCTGPARQVL